MSIRNSEGVISAWEPGMSAFNAWANPVVHQLQAVAELNLRTISTLNSEALKSLSTIGNTRNPIELPAVQWNMMSNLVRLFADYGAELGRVVSHMNERLHEVGRAQGEKNEIVARSTMETLQCRAHAASAPLTSIFQAMMSAVPDPEAVALQETEQAIAAARADCPAVTDRPRKAVVD